MPNTTWFWRHSPEILDHAIQQLLSMLVAAGMLGERIEMRSMLVDAMLSAGLGILRL